MNAAPEHALHRLLRPLNLRLARDASGPDDESPVFIDGDDYLVWDGHSVEETSSLLTRECLWDFVAHASASPQTVLNLVSRWGLLGTGDSINKPPPYWQDIEELRQQAALVRDILVVLAATEYGELVPESLLENLAAGDPWTDEDQDEYARRLALFINKPVSDVVELFLTERVKVRRERWQRYRAAGRGLALQMAVVVNLLNLASTDRGQFAWDRAGRRLDRIAEGVNEIVWSQLYTLFLSGNLDIYACSVCGRPYKYEPSNAPRRPRGGRRNFCSDACRRAAKLEANRLAWRQNGQRWRPSKKRQIQAEEGTHVETG